MIKKFSLFLIYYFKFKNKVTIHNFTQLPLAIPNLRFLTKEESHIGLDSSFHFVKFRMTGQNNQIITSYKVVYSYQIYM